MAQLSVLLDVSEDIIFGIDNGIYTISGGTVRNSAGKIVKLLKDAIPSKQDETKALEKIVVAMKNHKVITITAITAGAIIITGAVIYFTNKAKNKREAELHIPECITKFKKSFIAYLDAASKGTLDAETIDYLLASINELEDGIKDDRVIIDFSSAEFKTLMMKIIDYTKKLAEYTSFTLDEAEGPSSDNILVDLRNHLKWQKQIIGNVA